MPSVIVFVFSETNKEKKNAFDIFPGSVLGAPVGSLSREGARKPWIEGSAKESQEVTGHGAF